MHSYVIVVTIGRLSIKSEMLIDIPGILLLDEHALRQVCTMK